MSNDRSPAGLNRKRFRDIIMGNDSNAEDVVRAKQEENAKRAKRKREKHQYEKSKSKQSAMGDDEDDSSPYSAGGGKGSK